MTCSWKDSSKPWKCTKYSHKLRTDHERRASSKPNDCCGDIHGCSRALDTLLEAIHPTSDDTLVLLGDYVDHGPDSYGVMERLIRLKDKCHLVPLLGNHEAMMLDALENESKMARWLECGGEEALASYKNHGCNGSIPSAHLDFIKGCQTFYETDTHIFVHASYYRWWPMDQQNRMWLLWEPLDPEKAAPHCSGKTVIVSHEPQPNGQILDLGFVKCIDTLCHAGGWLTALDVHSGHIWQADQVGESRTTLDALGE